MIPVSMRRILCQLSFDPKTRIRTWRKLSTQTHYGLTVKDSVRTLHEQAKARNPFLAEVFEHVLVRLGSAHPLGIAITGFASSEEIMLITSGQKAGRLSESLSMAADLLEERRKIIGAVVSSLAYPLFLSLLAATMLCIVSIYVMPQLASLSDPTQWTGFARIFYLVSSFVGSWAGAIVAVCLCAGVCVVIATFPLWTGPWRAAVDSFAPWSLYRLTVGGVWLFTLATLMRSGMQLKHILNSMLSSDTISPYLFERVKGISDQVGRGVNIGEAMFLCGYNFPDREIVDDFRVYSALPQFRDQLQDMARTWLTDGIGLIQRKARVLNVLFMVFIIGQMAMIALSVMDLQTQISANTMGGVR